MHAAASTAPAAPPRASFPTATRTHERTDRRLREMADSLVRLNGESIEGASRRLMRLEGFSDWELDQYGEAAQLLANTRFVRQDAVIAPEPPSDAMLVAEASALHDELFARLVVKLRARPDFHEDRLAAIWPEIRKSLSLKLGRTPLPPRLPTNPSVAHAGRS